ncbi:conserved hypothetical protein [Kribbella flavida DSM 17836]|uniref:p-aminobenzoate N-oxygenase AurF n=1 Tax=Kribbella flavida (strain DSM 17836 / JCM 10339 / NBRC 14399) TaxID=479435 RepID=D2PSP4_KRIFD|nr:diiron oxygenase [Kribbella flavida]ADB33182.1 conserved hypothetical protein [Kribbella flavida DSM 17836]
MTTFAGEDTIGLATLKRLADTWPRRAAVRRDLAIEGQAGEYDATLPDYPAHLMPFAEHPDFLAATPEQRDRVMSGMWLGYNQRVIATESLIANPAFELVMQRVFPGSDDRVIQQTVQQSLVDESFHTYMHMMAVNRTCDLRGIGERPKQPTLITYRRLQAVLAEMTEQWQRDVAVLVWGAVAETCINALLGLIARDPGVQPMHSLITKLHLRDESAHGSVIVEVVKILYARMNQSQRDVLVRCLPPALESFGVQDPMALRIELRTAGIAKADDIVADVGRGGSGTKLVRDYSGTQRLVSELGLSGQVDFDFPDRPDWALTPPLDGREG